MTNIERFLAELTNMDSVMRQDAANGKPFRYCNVGKKKEKDFDTARAKNNRRLNCVDGAQWGLLRAGVIGSTRRAIQWYFSKGKIVYCSKTAEADVAKYFNVIDFKGKTVKQAIADGSLQPGDIVSYLAMAHTNVYMGNKKSFDSGHAYCSESGEEAIFNKWIGTTPYQGYKIGVVLRLKKKTVKTYRVRTGIFTMSINVLNMKRKIKSKLDLECFTEKHDDGTHVFCGSFNTKAKANERVKQLNAIDVDAKVIAV